jgi:hypothetical protein
LYAFLCPSPDYVKETSKKVDNINNEFDDKSKDLQNIEKFSMSSMFDGYSLFV